MTTTLNSSSATSVALFIATGNTGLSTKERVSNAWKLRLTCESIARIFGWSYGATQKRIIGWRKESPDMFPPRTDADNASLIRL